MRRLIASVAFVSCVLVGASVAEAGTITMSWGPSVFDPADILFDGSGQTSCTVDALPSSLNCQQLIYSHDLTELGFVPGATSDDQLTAGLLEIFLQDDGDSASEGFKFLLEGLTQGGTQSATTTFSLGSFSATVLALVQLDGILNVTFNYQNGDFTFLKSEFTGYGTREQAEIIALEVPATAAVPEPATLLLLGGGLTAIALRTRRRKA